MLENVRSLLACSFRCRTGGAPQSIIADFGPDHAALRSLQHLHDPHAPPVTLQLTPAAQHCPRQKGVRPGTPATTSANRRTACPF
jgi:hypothetical protein